MYSDVKPFPEIHVPSVPSDCSVVVVMVVVVVVVAVPLVVVDAVLKSLHVSQHSVGYLWHIESVATQLDSLSPYRHAGNIYQVIPHNVTLESCII